MKSAYLNKLRKELYFVDSEEREQIIDEYSVHFEERIKEGSSVNQVINNLGTPKTVAIEYATELDVNYSGYDKFRTNLKEERNKYLKTLKSKASNVKKELGAKQKNQTETVEKVPSDSNSAGSKVITVFATWLYFVKTAVIFGAKLFITCFSFVGAVTCAVLALGLIATAILLPIFISIMNNTGFVWFLIYGSLFSLVTILVMLSLIFMKRFGAKNHE